MRFPREGEVKGINLFVEHIKKRTKSTDRSALECRSKKKHGISLNYAWSEGSEDEVQRIVRMQWNVENIPEPAIKDN